jgi:prepilin-type N-terminal cleavage/methylation domain-containing protein
VNARSEQGFTLVEVLLAVIVLSIGVMALVGSSALATRMIGRGKTSSQVAQISSARAELLRAYAAQAPGCTNASLQSGSDSTSTTGIKEQWTLGGTAGDATRDVSMTLTYPVAGATKTMTSTITLYCK